jgi:alkylated DNA repair dioxygenase AlkB
MSAPPSGFVYHPDVLSESEEAELAERLRAVEYSAVAMRGQVARRRTAHFGWVYGYESWRIAPGPPVPDFLQPLRERVGALAGLSPEALAEVLLTEYPPAAGIGWHRDAPQFGEVIGVSLLSECRMRFRRGGAGARETTAVGLAPRSVYVLRGAARQQWQHSIPPTRRLRYSITFRTLRETGRRTSSSVVTGSPRAEPSTLPAPPPASAPRAGAARGRPGFR